MLIHPLSNKKTLIIIVVSLLLLAGIILATRTRKEPLTVNPEWKLHTDESANVSFSYPSDLRTAYTRPLDWPPKVQVIDESFTCTEAGSETDRAGKTEKKLINDVEYCVTSKVEGAAGSIYRQYAYSYPYGDRTVILTFSLRSVQCGNYSKEKKLECETEREIFNLDYIISKISESLEIK